MIILCILLEEYIYILEVCEFKDVVELVDPSSPRAQSFDKKEPPTQQSSTS